jgi:hypothetical protein
MAELKAKEGELLKRPSGNKGRIKTGSRNTKEGNHVTKRSGKNS